jgi:hypothetical protein
MTIDIDATTPTPESGPRSRRESTPGDYARAVRNSKRVRWEIERDVLRGRVLDARAKFLPDGLSLVNELDFLSDAERRLLSQIQGRTYANVFGLVERYIAAKVLGLSQAHFFGDQMALEALVRFGDEELKHQEMFRRVERLAADALPSGYRFVPDPNEVAHTVLTKSTWSVLALTCLIELFTQSHYRHSIGSDPELSELYKDVFLFHWKEESQHALVDELEWMSEDGRLDAVARDGAVDDLIALVFAVDGMLRLQSASDAQYFAQACDRPLTAEENEATRALLLKAYRFQYIFSGIKETRFPAILLRLISTKQFERIEAALATLA